MPAHRSSAPQWIVVAALLVSLAVPRSAAAGTVICVGRAHGCFTSLQAAVDAAQEGSTIKLAPGTYRGGVVVARSVRLAGSGAGRTVIRGGPVLTLGGTITVSDLTVTGGVTSTNPRSPECGPDVPSCGPGYADATALGGGIEAQPGSTVTLLRTVVAGNRAMPSHTVPSVKATCPDGPCPASFGDAAGIDNWGTMRLVRSVVRDNHAAGAQSQGGGIVSEAGAGLALEHSVVAGNHAEAIAPYGRFANGGGIYVDGGGTLSVDHSAITGNRASLANSIPHPYPKQDGGSDGGAVIGGGIFVFDGSGATIRHSRVDGNTVAVDAPLGEPYGDAAGLCSCTGLPLTLTDTSIAGNRLVVRVLSSDDTGPSGNTALDSGGPTTIRRTRITGNHGTITAPTGGAGILGAVLDHATIGDNHGTASGLTGLAQGGGIWNGEIFGIPTAPPTLRHTRVTGNVLTAGPGLDVRGGGLFTVGFPPVLTDSRVTGNLPDQCAGC